MNLHLHNVDSALLRRAKARASSLGVTLKAWVMALIAAAVAEPQTRIDIGPSTHPIPTSPVPVDARGTVSRGRPAPPTSPTPPTGRRDLIPPTDKGGSQ